MDQEFTRQSLYDLVWTKPFDTIGAELGISVVRLRKVCWQYDIPHPPAGWWRKLYAGTRAERTPLPDLEPDANPRIVLVPTAAQREPNLMADAREQAWQKLAASRLPAMPDPIVEQSIEWVRTAPPGGDGLVRTRGDGLCRLAIATASIERASTLLRAVAGAGQVLGFHPVAAPGGAAFLCGRERVAFSLSETKRLVPAGGGLMIELERVDLSGGPSPRRTFSDSKTQRVEDLIDEIVIGLAVIAAVKRDQRQRVEAASRDPESMQPPRGVDDDDGGIEQRRMTAVQALLQGRATLDRLRQLVAALDQGELGPPGPRAARLRAWLIDQIEEQAAAPPLHDLERWLEVKDLFGSEPAPG